MQALVVEDEHALQVLYAQILSAETYTVSVANNGDEAIEHLKKQMPKLVFLDIRLPMVNGIEVIDYIEAHPDVDKTHVVIVSSSQEFVAQIQRLPSAEFLLKPILPKDVRRIARDHLP